MARASGAYCGRKRLKPGGSAVEGCGGLLTFALHARERLGRVLLELAELVERRGLLVEPRVGLFAQLDDAGVPRAGLVLGIGRGVIELLLQRECLRQVLLRVRERLLELDRCGVAELRLREAELLRARLDGVVGLDERGGGATLELRDVDLLDRGRARRRLPRRPSCAGSG